MGGVRVSILYAKNVRVLEIIIIIIIKTGTRFKGQRLHICISLCFKI